ncbi:MAG: hypothetical protein RBJ76_01215 [Stenomitos frigidus ULC029]
MLAKLRYFSGEYACLTDQKSSDPVQDYHDSTTDKHVLNELIGQRQETGGQE